VTVWNAFSDGCKPQQEATLTGIQAVFDADDIIQ
jgi:hypothetical protein